VRGVASSNLAVPTKFFGHERSSFFMSRANKTAATILVTIYAVFLCYFVLACVDAGLQWVNQRYLTVFPTPDRKSAFFDAYNPDTVLSPVSSPHFVTHGGESKGGAGGRKAAELSRHIERFLALHGEQPALLMQILGWDIYERLEKSGVRIVSISGNEDEGYEFHYTQRQGSGTVVLKPVEIVDPYEVRARSQAHPNPHLCELGPLEIPSFMPRCHRLQL
jgi:hypothetical protein